MSDRLPISEEWLRSVGFRWSQIERQSEKHWILWLGNALVEPEPWPGAGTGGDSEQLGIEISNAHQFGWNVWMRSDLAGLYHRFIHLRHVAFQDEVIALVEALTGQSWDVANHWWGAVCTPVRAQRHRAEQDRLDLKRLRAAHPWYEQEKDPSRARALPEEKELAIKTGIVK